jgi:hypothetical protein
MIVSNQLGWWHAWRRLLMPSNRHDRDSQMRCELALCPKLSNAFLCRGSIRQIGGYGMAGAGAERSVAYWDLECPLLGVERKSDFEGGRSVDDPERTWVVFLAACCRRRAASQALSDLAHNQVRSKKIVSGQRKGIVPRLTKGNGHDRFSYHQGRSNDFR